MLHSAPETERVPAYMRIIYARQARPWMGDAGHAPAQQQSCDCEECKVSLVLRWLSYWEAEAGVNGGLPDGFMSQIVPGLGVQGETQNTSKST